jgi:two-component system response regulator (stage 0 sporulation protein F)
MSMAARNLHPETDRHLVLVVEDEPDLRAVVTFILEEEGFTVTTAADGQQALDRFNEARPDLVVLDMGLPILSGEEVAAEMQKMFPEPPPVLVMSAAGAIVERARRIGAASYIAKPFDLDELARAVHRIIDKSA